MAHLPFTESEITIWQRARLPDLKPQGSELRGVCPVHGGTNPSSFSFKPDTGASFCHSACNRGWGLVGLEAILMNTSTAEAMRSVCELVGKPVLNGTGGGCLIETEAYDYLDEAGNLLFQQVRLWGTKSGKKGFKSRRPDGNGGWANDLKGVRRVLYRLPRLKDTARVFIVEGEKDVHTLEAWGLVATTCPSGSGKWRDEYSPVLAGKEVIILPDNDEPGRKHAAQVREALKGIARSALIVTLPIQQEKADVTDWRAAGGTAEELARLIGEAQTKGLAAGPVSVAADSTPTDAAHTERLDTPSGLELPPHYQMTSDGLLFNPPDSDKKPVWLCAPFEVPFLTHSPRGTDPGRLIRFIDSRHCEHEVNLTDEKLVAERGDWRQLLAMSGLRMKLGRLEAVLLRDCLYDLRAPGHATKVDQVGWHGDVYVTPAWQQPEAEAERFLFDDQTGREYHFGQQGTLEDWQRTVGRLCAGNSLLMFAVSGAFAPLLLRLKAGMGGGFHFGGGTSCGKTTTLTAASSVWGDPKGFVQSWNATKNALEALGHSHNHCLLALDEVKELDPREAVTVAYMLANGCGKGRSNVNAQLRPRQHWELIFYSTGELGYLEHAATTGQRTYGGQSLRVLEIPSDRGRFGSFDDLHEHPDGGRFAQVIADASRHSYGTAAPAFVKSFLALGADKARERLNQLIEEFRTLLDLRAVAGEVERAIDRFAIVAAAGELATEWGITGWATGEALVAAAHIVLLWLESRGTLGSFDEHQALKHFSGKLSQLSLSRFQEHNGGDPDKDKRPFERLGYKTAGRNGIEFQFPKDQGIPSELRGNYPQEQLLKALRKRGALVCEGDRPTTYRSLPEFSKRVRCFVVLQEKLLTMEDSEAFVDEETRLQPGRAGIAA